MSEQRRFYVHVNGVKLHYLEFGTSGPVVMLVPGIMSPAAVWAFVGEGLSEYAHVLVLDNRGRGLSDQRPGLGYSLDDYAADIAGLIDVLGMRQPLILGHSMGARIAIRTAARYPASIGKLILVDPPVSGPGRRPYPSPLSSYITAIESASRGEALPQNPLYAEHGPRFAEWLPTCSIEAITATHRGFHDEDIFPDLPQIACPTLLLYAERGETILDSDADELMRGMPHATCRKLPGVGHMIPFENLSLFLHAVGPFIRS